MKAVKLAQLVLREWIRPGDVVLDATCGNGWDTVFLLEQVGVGGRVYALDIQAEAVEETRRRCGVENVMLLQGCHSRLGELLPSVCRGSLRAVLLNLGYLPGGDKALITRKETTLLALVAALDFLAADGLLSVVLYPGHEGGGEEAEAVKGWAAGLDGAHFLVSHYGLFGRKRPAPEWLCVRKRGS